MAIGDVVYWSFGDTLRASSAQIPNSIGWSADTNASDCITLTPKEAVGAAAPLLAADRPGELTVWPLGMEATGPDRVHFFYASVVPMDVGPDRLLPWKVAGVGIASFDTGTLSGQRALEGDLVWQQGVPMPDRTYADGEYVYVFSDISRQLWTTDTILSRVPTALFDSPADYEYWEPGGAGEPGRWLTGLWDAQAGYWDPALANVGALWRQAGMHNGVEVAYNQFLGKWVAVYATNFSTSINVRLSDTLTGPWEETDRVMLDCRVFHPLTSPFACYTAVQHEVYSQDGDRTMYISYSNWDTYQVYLHEIRLAAAVTEWIDDQGRTIYLAGSAQAPSGFQRAGVSFYASDIPVPGFQEIHRWQHVKTGESRYSAVQPEPIVDYQDMGVAFFVPADAGVAEATNARYSPVYRWTRAGSERYSPLDLIPLGYEQQEIAFFAACPESIGGAAADCPDAFLGPGSFDSEKDSDGDGCTDVAELGSNPFIGGQRDPNNYWDFYDVPDIDGVRDGDIGFLTDILPVVFRLGTNDRNGTTPVNRYSDPQAPPEDMVSYHPAFDRSPPPLGAANQYALGPPDGVINLWDAFGVILQYMDRC